MGNPQFFDMIQAGGFAFRAFGAGFGQSQELAFVFYAGIRVDRNIADMRLIYDDVIKIF